MRFNQVIRSIVNYYGFTVDSFSLLNKYVYIFNYSCAHTLANKHNCSLAKIFEEFGHPIKVKQKGKSGSPVKELVLLDYLACKKLTLDLALCPAYGRYATGKIGINQKRIYRVVKISK